MAETKFWLFSVLHVFIVLLPWVSCSPTSQCGSTTPAVFTVTVESMGRQQKAGRFLLVTEKPSGKFDLSFTGRRGAPGTKFILKMGCSGRNLVYTLRLSKKPDFILAVENGQLAVKNASVVDLTDDKFKFEKKKVVMIYTDNDRNSEVQMDYYALMSLSGPRAVIKINRKSGRVFLDKKKNWKECRAWVKIDIIE